MALINCPDCGNEVSDLAVACPKCARPIACLQPVIHSKSSKKRWFRNNPTVAENRRDWLVAAVAGVIVCPFLLWGVFAARVWLPTPSSVVEARSPVLLGLVFLVWLVWALLLFGVAMGMINAVGALLVITVGYLGAFSRSEDDVRLLELNAPNEDEEHE